MRFVALLLAMSMTVVAAAQVCSPDPAYTTAGIYPDSATGIPPAQEGTPYEIVATIVAPTDTLAIVIPGTPAQTVLIDSIVLDTLLGLPSWASYTCEPTGCAFPGGVPGCIFITGTPGPGESGMAYSIGFVTKSYGRLQLLPAIQLPAQIDTTLNYYNLIVEPGTGRPLLSISPTIFPNPAVNLLQITQEGFFTYTITDMAGRMVATGNATNRQSIAVQQWAKGLYVATISPQKGNQTTHKVVIQ